jgi:hypothetical protein
MSVYDLEQVSRMDARQDKDLDEALARAREAFAGKTDEQLMDEVAEVIDSVRAARRKDAVPTTSA